MSPCEMTGRVVVVVAFQTVYTLERNRRDNNKKIVTLFVGMKDMMGALLLYVFSTNHGCPLTSRSLKDVENDKAIAPDGTTIENRLKSLIERTEEEASCQSVVKFALGYETTRIRGTLCYAAQTVRVRVDNAHNPGHR
jgi:hypothetical protein